MHPILIDLSQWRPFGLALETLGERLIGFVLIGALVYILGVALARRAGTLRKADKQRWADPLYLLTLAGIAVGVVGLLWVVSRAHSYGVMMALGFLVAMGHARWQSRKLGENPDVIGSLGMVALVGGVVGARISYVIEHWDRQFAPLPAGHKLIEAFKLTSGGLVFDGGLLLAIVLVVAYLIVRRLPARRFLDILAVSAMIGLSFGRMGCFLNGCCYGGRCDPHYSLAVQFPYAGRPVIYPHGHGNPYPDDASLSPVFAHQWERRAQGLAVPDQLVEPTNGGVSIKTPGQLHTPGEYEAALQTHSLPVHPAQLYGLVNALVLAGLLTAFLRLRTGEGQVFALLFILYPITRFILEYIRDDNPDMHFTPAQYKCMGLLIAGLIMLVLLRRLPASCGPTWRQRAELAAAADKPGPPAGAGKNKPPRKRKARGGRP